MTDPQPMTVQAGAGVVQGPDGRALVMVVLASGMGRYQVPIAAQDAARFADDLANAIKAAAREAKRANMGIMLATPNMVPDLGTLLSGSNGQLPPGLSRDKPGL